MEQETGVVQALQEPQVGGASVGDEPACSSLGSSQRSSHSQMLAAAVMTGM